MHFHKVSGAGNDFIALLEPETEPDSLTLRAWCRRGLSIGADGVFALAREGAATRMVHWNADGGRSDLCLNGSRCAARLAFDAGWCANDQQLELLTDAGSVLCRRLDRDTIEITLPWPLAAPVPISLGPTGGSHPVWNGHSLTVGVPHLVIEMADEAALRALDLPAVAPALRSHAELGNAGANVNFVARRTPHDAMIRTWERGVEGETLACGSGAIAAAMTGFSVGRMTAPVRFHTLGGPELTVGGDLTRATLAGDARLVATGEIQAGATGGI